MQNEDDLAPGVLNELAARLRRARQTRRPCPSPKLAAPELSLGNAYQIQCLNAEYASASGVRTIGQAIGMTRSGSNNTRSDQIYYGTLFADMCFGDTHEVAWQSLIQPQVGAGVAFVLGRDLDSAQICIPDLIGAIAYLLPAIEIVDSRIESPNADIVDTVADNGSCAAVVLGTSPRALSDVDLRLCGAVTERRGEPVSVGAGASCFGNPLNAVLWVAREMVKLGSPLTTGSVVLSGRLGPLVAAEAGDIFEAKISGLGSVRATFGSDDKVMA